MPPPIRILLIEDSVEDAELILLHLQSHGIQYACVREATYEGFLAAFTSGTWDLVLSDFDLVGTTGLEILRCLRGLDPSLPFILLSGVLDEGAAVEAMRQGANDFLLKGNLARLVPAIERELKEFELRKNNQRFEEELRLLHTAIGQTPDMVLITDAEGVILYANPATEASSGFTRQELVGHNPRVFKSDQHDPAFYRSMWETLLRGGTWKGLIVNQRKDGTLWDAEAVIAPVFNDRGDLQNYLCTARDITLQRQLQNAVEQNQRLETIGTLTSGIAHDFNNILMPVLGHAELGMSRAPGDAKLRHDLEVIQASAYRARDLIRQILTFSQKGEGGLVPMEVQGLVSESLRLLRATIPSSIALVDDLDAKGKFVLGDPTKLYQVVLNLCTNAGYAMRGTAGRLTVRLKAERFPATACAMNIDLEAGDYLCLEVTDTGKGMAFDLLDKIFLPFFTTKPPQEGTGLGLSVTHSIVSAMGGGIRVTSETGVGTTFKVLLPISVTGARLRVEGDGMQAKGEGHILLVDDEQTLLEMLQVSLTQMGFQVTSFSNPQIALRVFMGAPFSFHILVTDHTMPSLSGVQLAQALRKIRPDFPCLLLSGDPEVGEALPSGQLADFEAVLAKPISSNDLAKSILKAMHQVGQVSPKSGPR